MPVESVRPLLGRPLRTAALATPPRLRPKGPVGPDFYRQSPTAAERPRQSAVERLEADKAKYVKSPVALSKQQPIRPPVMLRKPPAAATAAMRPTRKTPTQQNTQQGNNVPFNLEHLSNLINGVNDGHLSTSTVTSNCTTTTSTTTTRSFTSSDLDDPGQGEERSGPPPGPDWSSPAKVRLKASGPAKAESPGPVASSPAAVTVRRVDVMPQARPARTPPCRPARYIRQPLQPMPLLSQSPLRPATSNQHLFYPRKLPGPSPLKPVCAPLKPDHPAAGPVDASAPAPALAPPPLPLPVLPPASPAITRLSSSSRKRPSLTRSKSDMSERYSRAGTELSLERFFNLCGLDPSELQDLTKASSDIVSLARFRSASAPGSECGGSDGEEGGDDGGEDDGGAGERVPYGVSVIERNARVIKWLYGVKQAKDNTKVTNM